jgi:hypothetical protein
MQPKILRFSGSDWTVRTSNNVLSGPGPNRFDPRNAFLDLQGDLHLQVIKRGGVWTSAEVTQSQSLGFGTYQFQTIGRLDLLDPQIVLGLFNYPPPTIGPDGTNEIDIEFAHWGNAKFPIGNFTLHPATLGLGAQSHTFDFTQTGTYMTHRFVWKQDRIRFQSLHGHRNLGDNTGVFADWEFVQPTTGYVPQSPMPIHLNFWLFQGKAPQNAKTAEIILRQFLFQA